MFYYNVWETDEHRLIILRKSLFFTILPQNVTDYSKTFSEGFEVFYTAVVSRSISIQIIW